MGRAIAISLVMMLAALLALREASRVEPATTKVASVAPVTTVAPDATPPVDSTSTSLPATPPTTAAATPPSGLISLGALASEAMEEAAAAPPTTTKPRPVAQPTTTTTVVNRSPAPTTTKAPAATTTTVKKTTTTVSPAARAGTPGARNQIGAASWFSAPDGSCAHNVIPKGTTVTVTRLSTGASTTCYIDQGGPSDTTRIIDLSKDTFEKLADPSVGLIEVRIEW